MREERGDILVVAGSGIGNILLATPLIRSLRRAYPDARIDVLVPQGRGGVLEGNPDVTGIVEVCKRQGMGASMRFVRRIWRRYDLALSACAGDRSLINAWIGGRQRFSHVAGNSSPRGWRRLLLDGWVVADDRTHAVVHGLRLLDDLSIPKCYEVVPPVCAPESRTALDVLLPFTRAEQAYAVMHFDPRNPYKCWTAEGWGTVIRHAVSHGLRVVLTGGGGGDEESYIRSIVAGGADRDVVNLAGQLSLPQVSDLLSRCSLYVGPDTGVTHLAAAHAIPTIAMYGPTDPVYWGPWPCGYSRDTSPYVRGGRQQVGNVTVVQGDGDCVGCGREGCDDDPGGLSRCMQELPATAVVQAMDEMMASGGGADATVQGGGDEDSV